MKKILNNIISLLFSKKISFIEKKINYEFTDKKLLELALTHPSYKKHDDNYQRLEFLGDAIIDNVVSNYLFNKFPFYNEGELTEKRASLVNSKSLGAIGLHLGLINHAKLDSCIDLNDEKVASNISADIYEAIIGAVSIDANYASAKEVIENTLLNNKSILTNDINYKGKLIEYCHSNNLGLCIFNIIKHTGPAHKRLYYINVNVNNKLFYGKGTSKKNAEQRAAKNALEKLI